MSRATLQICSPILPTGNGCQGALFRVQPLQRLSPQSHDQDVHGHTMNTGMGCGGGGGGGGAAAGPHRPAWDGGGGGGPRSWPQAELLAGSGPPPATWPTQHARSMLKSMVPASPNQFVQLGQLQFFRLAGDLRHPYALRQ